ncbi:hypothetical protein [Ruegeria arenilitoris]|uniref:hypothetical protein n=1 Tax=Ruegeria arenilitoris TaxID=1173585 RepID=UPI001481109A|nr:hypothetical protein [Ruegeria arenilitoris]
MSDRKWVRIFTEGYQFWQGNPPLPKFGQWIGVVDVGDIIAVFPNRTDDRYVNIRYRKDSSDGPATMVLRSELHLAEPKLAATFPLPQNA